MSKSRLTAGILCILAGLLTQTAIAEVPHTVTFQGRMKDSTGTPYTGAKSVKFTIYNGTGTEIWNSGVNSVTFTDGLVTVQLGAPPHPPLPTGNWRTDTALTLGITVDSDPEITPRIPLTSTGYAFHASTADSVVGLDTEGFVRRAGDTMSGPLGIVSQPGWAADSAAASLVIAPHSKTWHTIGDGLGDVRIGDSTFGLSIGVNTTTGLKGWATIWSEGEREIIRLATRTSNSQLVVDGNNDHVYTWSNLSINSTLNKTGLSLFSQNNWRWDVGAGNGDFYLGNSTMGFRIGYATGGAGAGSTRFWTGGGIVNYMTFGSPVAGDVMRIDADKGNVQTWGDVGVGTGSTSPVAPLTVQSKNQSRWDVDSGNGDFRIVNGSGGGLSMGVSTTTGSASIWSKGAPWGFGSLAFGNDSAGQMLLLTHSGSIRQDVSGAWSLHSGGSTRLAYASAFDEFVMYGSSGNWKRFNLRANQEWGELKLNDSGGVATVWIDAGSALDYGGTLQLNHRTLGGSVRMGMLDDGAFFNMQDTLGISRVRFDPDGTGPDAARLPADGISSIEIWDEVGFSSTTVFFPDTFLVPTANAADIVTTSLGTPRGGWVEVEASLTLRFEGTTGANYAWFQIDTDSGGGQNVSFPFIWMGQGAHASTAAYYETVTIKRQFFVDSAGVYSFRMEGNEWSSNGVSAVTRIWMAQIQATFYGTLYGPVFRPATVRGSAPSADASSETNGGSSDRVTVVYEDLSTYQSRLDETREAAERAAREAEEAEYELWKAERRLQEQQDRETNARLTRSEQ